jgi:transposase
MGHRWTYQRGALAVYVEKILVPTLTNGDVVILDNLGSHKGQAARSAVRQATHMIFLPPHSADLNPIEQLFAKLRYPVRKAQSRIVGMAKGGENPRPLLTNECANYLRSAKCASM